MRLRTHQLPCGRWSDFKFTRSATEKDRWHRPQRMPGRVFTSPGLRYERQSAPPAQVPRASLRRAVAWHRAPQKRDPGPKHQPLRRPLRAGFPPLLSDAARLKGQLPTEPIRQRQGTPRGPSTTAGNLRTACTLGSRFREGRRRVTTDR